MSPASVSLISNEAELKIIRKGRFGVHFVHKKESK